MFFRLFQICWNLFVGCFDAPHQQMKYKQKLLLKQNTKWKIKNITKIRPLQSKLLRILCLWLFSFLFQEVVFVDLLLIYYVFVHEFQCLLCGDQEYMIIAIVLVFFLLHILYSSDSESISKIQKPRAYLILEHVFAWATLFDFVKKTRICRCLH